MLKDNPSKKTLELKAADGKLESRNQAAALTRRNLKLKSPNPSRKSFFPKDQMRSS